MDRTTDTTVKLAPCQGDCFVCGNPYPGNLSLRRTGYDGQTLSAQFIVTDAHLGGPHLAHGGALAAVMDEVLGSRAWLLGHLYATAQLDVTYLAPVPILSTVFITARCDQLEGRRASLSGEARIGASDGVVAVRARGLFIQVPQPVQHDPTSAAGAA